MLQERNEVHSTKTIDLLLIVALLLIATLARFLVNAASAVGWGGVVQLVVFVLMIGLCFLLYKKRLSSYRYTLYYKEPDPEELDAFGQPVRNPYPTGTLIAERMLGDKVKSAEIILPKDMVALLKPGASAIGIILPDSGEKAPKLHDAVVTTGRKATAHSLIFHQNRNYYRLVFHPSQEMAQLLKDIIAAVQAA